MGVNSLPKTITRQRRDCDLNPVPTAPEYSTLTTRLPSNPFLNYVLLTLLFRQFGQFSLTRIVLISIRYHSFSVSCVKRLQMKE